MIDITVSNNQVEIDMTTYHSFNDKDTLAKMIIDIINKAKYSGESMIVFVDIDGNTKQMSEQW